MKIYYQWEPGAYSNLACFEVKELLNTEVTEITWMLDFASVWEEVSDNSIWVLPVENSYAGNIHENLYNFLRYDYKIIGEYNLEVNHCLLSKESDIKDIKKVYSHPQALSQCHNFLQNHNIKSIKYSDTAWAAAMVSESDEIWVWAIASSLAWDIYGLNILEESIQDQIGNTTRFFIIAPSGIDVVYRSKAEKVSIIFEARDIPSSLYKCLWAFATNHVNLTKIESMPSLKDPFTYMFWLDFEGRLTDENVVKSLHELEFFTNYIKILGEY